MNYVIAIAACVFGAATRHYVRLRFQMALMLTVILVLLTGCAALPMPFQPNSQENSNYAEGAFLVLATVDTLQTVQIAKHPKCYYEADPLARALYGTRHPSVGKVIGINLVMITVHTMVASWLDDKVAAENARYDAEDKYGVGPWYGARFVFHAVSLGLEGSAVLNNYNHGIHLTNSGCAE